MKSVVYIFLMLSSPLLCQAQWLTGIGSKWNDSFTEWALFTEEDELEGNLEIRWKRQFDWTVWDYQLGDERGSIKLSFPNDPSQWVIRGSDEVVTARTRWINDFREWRITNNSITLVFKSRWKNDFNEWMLDDDRFGEFVVVTEWKDDPREWQIIDELNETIGMTMKMAMVFIAIYHSSPKQ